MISALASYLQLVKGGVGSCLIKSRLFYFTQEDLITFYVGVLDCLIITTFLATHPPNQLLWAAPSLRLIRNSHSKPWWWSAILMTIHQETAMRGVLETWCTSRRSAPIVVLYFDICRGVNRCLPSRMVDFLMYSNEIIRVPEATLTLI